MLEELLVKNEDKTLEFKENGHSLPGILKTIVAFANSAGGTLVIGVEDKTKKVVGIPNILKEEERIANTISDSISPLIVPNIEIQTYRKKELMLIHVPYMAGPYYIKAAGPEKGVYVRFGSTNRVADPEMLDTLRLLTKKMTFDETPNASARLNTLDWEAITDCFKAVNKKITESKAEDLEILVQTPGKSVPSFGGTILFGLHRLKTFPDAVIRCTRYTGTTKSKVFDFTTITSYPVLAVEEAIHFIEKNSAQSMTFGRTKHTVVPQYPPLAIREAVINAVIHTDYSIKGSSILIAMFDDRIEISNPGGVPIGISLERALSGSSRVRNRVIALTFRELKLIEQWGSGLQRIIDSCKDLGLPAPKFEDLTTEFMVTLYAKKEHATTLDSAQKKLVGHLKKKKKISTKEAAELWEIAPRNARVKLKHLLDAGVIQRVGTSPQDPLSSYVLVK